MPVEVIVLYAVVQIAYLCCLGISIWFYTRPVDLVDADEIRQVAQETTRLPSATPEVIVLYPVLDELEATMRTAMIGFSRAEYPGARRVIAIPNADDAETISSLHRIQQDHAFLEVLEIPPTDDDRWAAVWKAWDGNPKAYWWHTGKRNHDQGLPPKKTRQLVYAFYTLAADHPEALLSYIDADSVIPPDYFLAAAAGVRSYDVIQLDNVAGNGMKSFAASMFAMDHMQWDGAMYQHMSAHGKHPFYVLGKGLFFRVSDLIKFGGFNPWVTIEDPEVGMRLWTNGCRLGIVRSPLIEEVPETFSEGIRQRKRWVAGFLQSAGAPLTLMGMPFRKRFRARLNLVPCISLALNPIGLGVGIAVLVAAFVDGGRIISLPLEYLSFVTIGLTVVVMARGQLAAWRQTALFLHTRRERLSFMARVNPLNLLVYWLWWSIPLAIGFWMFLADRGLRWERTLKVDANHDLVRETVEVEREDSVA